LAILCALFDLASAQWFYFSPDLADLPWLEAHRTEALVQLLLKYFYATVTLITCYAMMQAKDWARWTYLIIATVHFGIAFVLLGLPDATQNYRFFAFHGAMLPGILLFFLALFVLFTRDAREYFHGGGRPWWKIEEEADEREARRSRRK
jgi:hypothetical protein